MSTSNNKGDKVSRGDGNQSRWKKVDNLIDSMNDSSKSTTRCYSNSTKIDYSSLNNVITSGSVRSTINDKSGPLRSHSNDSRVVSNTNNIVTYGTTQRTTTPTANTISIRSSSNKNIITEGDNSINNKINSFGRTHKLSVSDDSMGRNMNSKGSKAINHPNNNINNNNNNPANNDKNNKTTKFTNSLVHSSNNNGIITNGIIRNGIDKNGIGNNGTGSNSSSTTVRMLRFKESSRRNKTIIELEEELRDKKRLLFELELRRIKNSIIAQSAVNHVNNKQAKYQLEINRLEEVMNRAREQLEEGYVVAQL